MLIRSFVTIALTAINVASAAGQILPSPPQNLTHVVDGTTVTLTWTAATGAAGYVVEASVIPGGPVVASLPIATPTLTVPNVPQGVYYVRVRAVSGGLQSPPSNEVVVAVTGGCPAPPLPPRLIVRAAGLDVTLGWGSSGGCAPTSYVVLAGSGPGLSDIAQVNAGGQLGLSAVAPAGTYYIRVVGTNSFGSASSEEMIARVAVNNVTDTIQPLNALFFDITLTQTGSYRWLPVSPNRLHARHFRSEWREHRSRLTACARRGGLPTVGRQLYQSHNVVHHLKRGRSRGDGNRRRR
jgi:hypothetical protein